MQLNCPTCGRLVQLDAGDDRPRHLPFCSRRCQLIDLGEWVEERRVVAGRAISFADEDLQGTQGAWP